MATSQLTQSEKSRCLSAYRYFVRHNDPCSPNDVFTFINEADPSATYSDLTSQLAAAGWIRGSVLQPSHVLAYFQLSLNRQERTAGQRMNLEQAFVFEKIYGDMDKAGDTSELFAEIESFQIDASRFFARESTTTFNDFCALYDDAPSANQGASSIGNTSTGKNAPQTQTEHGAMMSDMLLSESSNTFTPANRGRKNESLLPRSLPKTMPQRVAAVGEKIPVHARIGKKSPQRDASPPASSKPQTSSQNNATSAATAETTIAKTGMEARQKDVRSSSKSKMETKRSDDKAKFFADRSKFTAPFRAECRQVNVTPCASVTPRSLAERLKGVSAYEAMSEELTQQQLNQWIQ